VTEATLEQNYRFKFMHCSLYVLRDLILPEVAICYIVQFPATRRMSRHHLETSNLNLCPSELELYDGKEPKLVNPMSRTGYSHGKQRDI
jgi:hypothetical protein